MSRVGEKRKEACSSKGRAKKLRKIAEKGEIWSWSMLMECRALGVDPIPKVEMVDPVPRERITKLSDVAQIIWRVMGSICGSDVYLEASSKTESAKEWPSWLKISNSACIHRIVLCLGTQTTHLDHDNTGKPIRLFDPSHTKAKRLEEALLIEDAEPPWLDKGKEQQAHRTMDTSLDQLLMTPEELVANDFPRLPQDFSSRKVLADNAILFHEDDFFTNESCVIESESDDLGVPVTESKRKELPSVSRARVIANHCKIDQDYVQTMPWPNKTSPKKYALDCEMVQSAKGTELARFSLVDEDGAVIFDTLIKPAFPVIDYCTRWSGIDEKMLKPVHTSLVQAQAAILSTVSSNDILIGHSLENDLRVLKLIHSKCGDTSLLYSHPRGNGYKFSLRQLCHDFLNRNIQDGSHDSIEDARAALDLFKLKIQHGLSYGMKPINKHKISMLDHCASLKIALPHHSNTTNTNQIHCRVAVLGSDPNFVKRYATDRVSGILSSTPRDLNKHLAAGWHLLLVQYNSEQHHNIIHNHLPPDALCITILQPDLHKLNALDNQKSACRDIRATAQWTQDLEDQRLRQLSIVSRGSLLVHAASSPS